MRVAERVAEEQIQVFLTPSKKYSLRDMQRDWRCGPLLANKVVKSVQ